MKKVFIFIKFLQVVRSWPIILPLNTPLKKGKDSHNVLPITTYWVLQLRSTKKNI